MGRVSLDVMTGYQCRWVVFSDLVRGMSVRQSVRVGHIAIEWLTLGATEWLTLGHIAIE